ncbi:MAG: glucose-6-phosphate dehydrogenase assembly protein OpcA [Micrococcales bacterium]|nr:glucose-6-phosphate dehydrogenase assembly protein OpcA [Micrococcales bacterium]
MITELTDTTTGDVSAKLVRLRSEVGSMALGRVLTLVVVIDGTGASEAIEDAIAASRQHPCRIIVVIAHDRRGTNRLDAQIRLGGDAGASEVVVLRLHGALANHGPSVVVPLLLADCPIVAWWPGEAPDDVAASSIGAMAGRRITDAAQHRDPRRILKKRAASYQRGDTNLAWTRVTRWRGLLAATLDQAPFEQVTGAAVSGAPDSPSSDLLAAWLAHRLKLPVRRVATPPGSGIGAARLERKSGMIDLVRPGDEVATLSQPGHPDRRVSLPRPTRAECLANELRRLDPDDTYEDALLHGLAKVSRSKLSLEEAIDKGIAPDPAASRRLANRLRRSAAARQAAAMIEAPDAPEAADTEQVHAATARRLQGEPTTREQPAAPSATEPSVTEGSAAAKEAGAARRSRAATTSSKTSGGSS